MQKKKWQKKNIFFFTCCLILPLTTNLFASGFMIPEQGAQAMGQGNTGIARGLDASANWYNPATLSQLPKHKKTYALFGFTLINISGKYNGDIPGENQDSETETALVPHTYFAHRVLPFLSLGLGINAPFGLVNDWGENWTGQRIVTRVSLSVTVINPNIVVEIPEFLKKGRLKDLHVAFAAGLNFGFAKVLLSKRVDQSFVGATTDAYIKIRTPSNKDFLDLDSDPFALNWNAGLLLEWKNIAFGVSYRGRLVFKIDDAQADFYGVTTNLQNTLVDQQVESRIVTPPLVMLGLAIRPIRRLELEFAAYWTDWSVFHTVPILFKNNANLNETLEENWFDSWAFRFGAKFYLQGAPKHKEWRKAAKEAPPKYQIYLSLGSFYDNSPVPDTTISPVLPESDRYGFMLGGGGKWSFGKMQVGLDTTIMFLFADKRQKYNLVGAEAGSPLERTTANGDYESFAFLWGFSISLAF
ncbi:MAG: hypothetical protein D6805_01845 [Planctomycetota bacterium]|nr:MAG: hypothetical protein D6805_01845 [Planctomycetota bacterium]